MAKQMKINFIFLFYFLAMDEILAKCTTVQFCSEEPATPIKLKFEAVDLIFFAKKHTSSTLIKF
jgi:hypothetical protein